MQSAATLSRYPIASLLVPTYHQGETTTGLPLSWIGLLLDAYVLLLFTFTFNARGCDLGCSI